MCNSRIIKMPNQSGSALIDLALYLVAATVLLIYSAGSIRSNTENQLATAAGEYMLRIQGGINQYQTINDASLKLATPVVAGFVNPLQPTTAELITAKYLPSGFSAVSPNGLSFKHVLTKVNCPGVNCSISGFSYSTTGYRDPGGIVRTDLLGLAVAKMGVDGSQSFASAPGTLIGYGNSYSVANPAGNVTGVLAIRIGDTSGFSALLNQFYKLDGSRPLTGTMQANNNDIAGVKNITSSGSANLTNASISGKFNINSSFTPGGGCLAFDTGRIAKSSTGDGLLICNNNVWQTVGNAVSNIALGGSCTTNNQLGTDAVGSAFICNGSFWTSLGNFASPGDSCAPAGKTSTSYSTNEQLVCKNGVFVKLTSLLTKNVQVGNHFIVQDGNVVVKPVCDTTGVPNYTLTLIQSAVDVSTTPPYQSTYVSATNNGASWTVLLRLKRAAADGGAEVSGTTYGLSAIMTLECTY